MLDFSSSKTLIAKRNTAEASIRNTRILAVISQNTGSNSAHITDRILEVLHVALILAMAAAVCPVMVLASAISASPYSVAPEKQQELDQLMSSLKLHFDIEDADFTISASEHQITISVGALNVLWAASCTYWAIYQAFTAAQRAGQSEVRLGENVEAVEALQLYAWALQRVSSRTIEGWPRGIGVHLTPSDQPHDENLLAITELFLVATGWMLLHECGHITLRHPPAMAPRAVAEENEADAFATDHVLKGISDPAVIKKRALGIAVANVVLVALELIRRVPSNTRGYPPSYERLHSNLTRHPLPAECSVVTAFADALLQAHLTTLRIPHDVDLDATFEALLSDLCLAMSRARAASC